MKLDDFVKLLFARAKEIGLEEFDAYYSHEESFSVNIFEGKLDRYEVNTAEGLSFRVLKDGVMGYAYTETLDEDAANMLITMASDNAAVLEPKDPMFIFEGKGAAYAQRTGFAPELETLSAQDKIRLAYSLEKAAFAASDRVKAVAECTVASIHEHCRLINSKGVDCAWQENLLYAVVGVTVANGDRTVDGFDFICTRDPKGIDVEKLAGSAVEKTLARCGAHSIPSGNYKTVVDAWAAADLLECFMGIFSAENAQKGLSRLAGKEGELIANPAVTLVDDPGLESLTPEQIKKAHAFAARPFDGEGVPKRMKKVIDAGRLTTLLHNMTTAAKAGVEPTGNASRSVKGTVGIIPSNFFFVPGRQSQEEMLAEMGEGLLITSVSGLHAGANAITGDFSLLAEGFTVKDGKKDRPVEQITVAGNFYELLKDVLAVGNDLTFGFPGGAAIGIPSIRLAGVAVAGQA